MKKARDLLIRNLKRLRDSAGHWDQPELADRADISLGMIKKLERGQANPSLEMLDKLVDGFKKSLKTIQLSDLFLDESVPQVKPKTVAEMPVEELKSELAALKRDDLEIQRRVNAGIEKFKASYAEVTDAWDAWPDAKGKGEWRRHVALFFLTRQGHHLDHRSVPQKLKESLLKGLRFHGMGPSTPDPEK